jgi:hypothetical protein
MVDHFVQLASQVAGVVLVGIQSLEISSLLVKPFIFILIVLKIFFLGKPLD